MDNYFHMVRPPTEQTLTIEELKQYYPNSSHIQYVINANEDQQFVRPQVCYATQDENTDSIILHQQNQQQQRVQHHIVQQHVATSQQHGNSQIMQSVVLPHQTVLVRQNTQQLVSQPQPQEHIVSTQQRQQIHVYQPVQQQTRILFEQPSTVAYKSTINVNPQAVNLEFNQNVSVIQSPDQRVESIQQQERRDQTSPLHSARLLENSNQINSSQLNSSQLNTPQFTQQLSGVQRAPTLQGQIVQPTQMLMATGPVSMSGQLNILTSPQVVHSCQQQQNHNSQNKIRTVVPSNNNCVRLRNSVPVQTYQNQQSLTRAPIVKKQIVSPVKTEVRQIVLQVKQSHNTPNNHLNDLDDLEDSITAAVVQKVSANNQQPLNSLMSSSDTANSNILNTSTTTCQQRPDNRMAKNCSKPKNRRNTQHQQSYSFQENSDHDSKCDTLENTGRQQQLCQQRNEPRRDSARMLVILQSGEQRLITFTLPKETCAVQDLLDQVGIPYSPNTDIQCVSNPGTDIDYIVTVGHVDQFLGHYSQSDNSSPEKVHEKCKSPEPPKEEPPKYIEGMLALCKFCGYTGVDFSKCQRCKRKFAEEPKSIPQTPINNFTKESKGSKFSVKMTAKDNLRCMKDNPKRIKKARKDPEPEVLTLSSDEESSKGDQTENNSLDYEGPSQVHLKEPNISPDMEKDMKVPIRREPIEIIGGMSYTVVECRAIRIGSFKYTPPERTMFCSKGIRLASYSVQDPIKKEILYIHSREIVKILAHFGKAMPVIFVYVLPSCALYIRNKLNMVDLKDGIYFDSCATEEVYRRITILPASCTEEFQKMLYQFYCKPTAILDELTWREADEILTKICLRDRPSEYGSFTNEIRQILIYPPGKGGIPINTEDYGSLAQDQFLNDVIIDFYLKYLCKEILSEEMRNKTHVFSSFFYKRLTTKVEKSARADNAESKLSPAQKRHNRVKNWTKNVNIFEKDFIIIPINESSHWFLAIICFPGLKGPHTMIGNKPVVEKENVSQKPKRVKKSTSESCGSATTVNNKAVNNANKNIFADEERDEAEGTDSELDHYQSESESEEAIENSVKAESIKQPCILIFDSLAGVSRQRVVATLRDYLTCEYQSRTSTNDSFTRFSMRGCCPKVPQQNNFTDCGLYLLQYVEQFFKVPITDYTIPIKELADWFEEIVVTRKREEISNLIKKLVADYNPDNLPLPDISFPTLNGKLVEMETPEGPDEYDEHFAEIDEMEEEMCEDEDNGADYMSQEDETELSANEAVFSAQKSNNMKRSVTDSETDSESVSPVKMRLKLSEEDETLHNGRTKYRYS